MGMWVITGANRGIGLELARQLSRRGEPVLGTARALHFGKGYFDQTAEVWSDDGRLLAASHQVVYYKE